MRPLALIICWPFDARFKGVPDAIVAGQTLACRLPVYDISMSRTAPAAHSLKSKSFWFFFSFFEKKCFLAFDGSVSR
jgi:hypothetical protein